MSHCHLNHVVDSLACLRPHEIHSSNCGCVHKSAAQARPSGCRYASRLVAITAPVQGVRTSALTLASAPSEPCATALWMM